MSLKRFADIPVGTKFTLEGIEYIKIPDERINCCRANNASQSNDPNTKIQVVPITEVEVDDQLQ